MAHPPSTAKIVIIGGGVVGCSTAWHLARMGETDVVLLEKNELTAGSSWHAAGNCPNFSGSWSILKIQSYSTALYRELGELADYPMNYHVTGAIRLAHSRERMMEFERAVAMARTQGIDDFRMMSNDEMRDVYPFLETHDLEGGSWDPYDGDIDPAQLTQAFAKGARDMGVEIVRFCPVSGLDRQNGEWIVKTPNGEIRAEKIVNAAGYYAHQIWEMMRPFSAYPDRHMPCVSLAHQYLITEPIPELEAHTSKIPLLRDPDSSYYLRQEKHGLLLGPYERDCKAHWITSDDPMPDDFSFQLYPDDLERIEWHIEDACARVPILGTVGVTRVVNGPIPYTPDGNPLVGPAPGTPNAFEACVFTFGVVQGGGAGKVAAEWILQGETEWDMWGLDPRRFTGYVDQDHAVAKAMEIYGHEYAMHYPHYEWPDGRQKRLSPVHDRLTALGARFTAAAGWERAAWYGEGADPGPSEAFETWGRSGPWEDAVRAECLAVRDAAGLCDLPGFSRYRVEGEGAAQWLRGMITGALPKPGRIGLIYFADDQGRILSEMTVMRLSEDFFFLISGAGAEWHDLDWLRGHLPENPGFTLENVSSKFSCLVLSGPKSRDILSSLTDADLTNAANPWLTHQSAKLGDVHVQLVRVSYVGELGWEVHVMSEDAPKVWDMLTEAGAPYGLKPFGMYAMGSMRLEKSYRSWKGDLSTDYNMLSGGLGRFVKWDKPDFVGKAALERLRQEGVNEEFAILTVDAGDCDAPYLSSVFKDGERVGLITSGGYGYRVDKSIALGVLRKDCTAPGSEVEINIYGEMRRAVVEAQPHYDPANERLKS